MRLNEVSPERVKAAVLRSGIEETEAHWITTDFLSDTYWNDPKCARRRIMMCGGDRYAFFDALPEVDWGE